MPHADALVTAFIPEDRRLALAQGRVLPEQCQGAALFADISGFTPLTEALARELGPRRGAELLTLQLNRVYTALIGVVQGWGGSVIGFSGDAITCWFDDGEMPGKGLRRAVACALGLQEVMGPFGELLLPGGVQAGLALKVAVAAGSARRLAVGDPTIQRIDVLAGAMLDALADAEHAARQTEVVVDAATATGLGTGLDAGEPVREWRTTEGGQAVAVIAAASLLRRPPVPVHEQPALDEAMARQWVIPAVYERLRTEQGRFLAELRPASALFLQFSGLDFDHDPGAAQRLDAFVRHVQVVIDRYEGALIQLTTGDKGSYLYAAFGAPIAHDDDCARAVAAALELRRLPPSLAGIRDVRIGIAPGLMRVGAYGSETRLTYGVLGDATNLAARLMAQAEPGQVCLSAAAAEAVGERFELQPLGQRTFKGMRAAQPVFAAIGLRTAAIGLLTAQAAGPLVGRAAEWAQLGECLRRAHAGAGLVVRLEGEAGAGKSHLAAHLLQAAAEQGFAVAAAACQSTTQTTAYAAARPLLAALLHIEDLSASAEADQAAAVRRLEDALAAIEPGWLLRLPLLGDVLGLPIPDNPTTAAFDAGLRREALAALVVDIVRRRAQAQPLLIVVEDAHWLDEASRGLLLALARVVVAAPILLLLVQRPLGPEQAAFAAELAELPAAQTIALHELDGAAGAELVHLRLGAPADPLAGEFIRSLAQGNPFFIEELVDALREGQRLVRADGGHWQLAPSLVDALRRADCLRREGEQWRLAPTAALAAVDVGVPASIHGLVLSRLDRLPEDAKLTLKVAGVIGRVFDLDLLAAAHPSHPAPARLTAQLALVQERDFARLETLDPRPVYQFKHNITQEVVYQTLLEAQRKELHLAAAEALEERSPDAVEELARHFGQADTSAPRVRARLLHYVDAAAWRSRRKQANETALAWFDRALQLELRWEWLRGRAEALHVLGRRLQEEATLLALDEAADADTPAQRLAGQLLWADYYIEVGEYPPAIDAVDAALALALQAQEPASEARCINQRARIAWKQGDYGAAQVNYAGALAIAQADPSLADAAAEAEYGLGLVHRQQSRYAEARHHFVRALELDRQLGDLQHEARTLNALGSVANLERDFHAAVRLFEQALQIRETIGDRAGVGTSLMSLAQAYGYLGDYGRVAPLLQQALEIQQAVRNPWEEMLVLNELGILYTAVGEYARALDALGRALARSRSMDSEIGAAYILCNLGQAQRDAGQITEAATTLAQGLALAQAQGDVNLEAIYLADMALNDLRAQDYAGALEHAGSALALFTELDQPLSTTGVHATLAAAWLGLGEAEAARAAALEAVRILDACGGEGPDFPHRDYSLAAQVLAALGEAEAASQARSRAGAILAARAARISDAEMRAAYLAVAVNASTDGGYLR